ncbi:MAG: phosphotransferase [Myxococcota bacterium]
MATPTRVYLRVLRTGGCPTTTFRSLSRLLVFICPGDADPQSFGLTPSPFCKLGGTLLGRIDTALSDFSHPGMNRHERWDLKNATLIAAYIADIPDKADRQLIEYFYKRFDTSIAAQLAQTRQSVIHNDANAHNILLGTSEPTSVDLGLIDFGDVVRTHSICELAIACAYSTLGQNDAQHRPSNCSGPMSCIILSRSRSFPFCLISWLCVYA